MDRRPSVLMFCFYALAFILGVHAAHCQTIADTVRRAHYRHHGMALLNDTVASPGMIHTRDVRVICTKGYAATQRHTSAAVKAAVYLMYAVRNSKARPYEIDHIISLELGGADTKANMFAQPYWQHPGAHEKDWLENVLHREVCAGRLSIDSAQAWIARDWYRAYLTYHGP